MKKKFLAILLALGLVITCMPMGALAANSGLSVDKTKVKKGETVRLTLTLPASVLNLNLNSIDFKATFDQEALQVTSVSYEHFSGEEKNVLTPVQANAKGYVQWGFSAADGNFFTVSEGANLYAEFESLKDSGSVDIALSSNPVNICSADETSINWQSLDDLPADFVKSVTLQLTGAGGVEKLTRDAHIKGNVLDVTEEYNVVIIYNDDAVYTYIPNDAKDSDINKTYQNAENGVALSPTDKDTVRGKWCGYGDGVDNVGFDGNKNRITIINGMDVAGTVTATAAKDAGIKGETFSINLTTSDEVDGSANYAILRDACITGSTEEQLNAAFNQCGSSDKFGTRTISTGGFSLGAINTQGNTIKYANIYYSLTGNPGTGMANWGGTVNTTLGTITITVQAA